MTLQTYYGNTDPLQGWYSDAYGQVQKNHVVGYTQHGDDATYVTLIALGPDAAHAGLGQRVRHAHRGRGSLSLRVCAADTAAAVGIANPGRQRRAVTVGPSHGMPPWQLTS